MHKETFEPCRLKKKGVKMREVRNSDGRLVCFIDEAAGIVEIKIKDCITQIIMANNGYTEVTNKKDAAT